MADTDVYSLSFIELLNIQWGLTRALGMRGTVVILRSWNDHEVEYTTTVMLNLFYPLSIPT